MPFRPDPFLQQFEPLRRWQRNPYIGYSTAFVAVAGATLLRLAIAPMVEGVPFITFYPAIAIAAAVGGTRPGILALALSAGVTGLLLDAPEFGLVLDKINWFELALFLCVSALMIMPIILFNTAIERLAAQVENSRTILESQPAGIVAVDDRGRITLVNSAVERQLGYSREELLDRPVEVIVPPDLRQDHEVSRDAFLDNPVPRRMGAGRDLHALAKDGSLLPVEIGLNPVVQGDRSGALATIVDISERKNLEWRTQALANEVQHRSSNLLAIIQVLANRMLPAAESKSFTDLLSSLARTNRLFGTATTGSLRALIEAELAPFQAQCSISDCDLLVSAKAGQDIILIIHELATNAIKYGALSTAEGQISVTGTVEDGVFRLCWQERGGPPVQKPERKGLGETILRRLPEAYATEVTIDYAEDGLRYLLVAPADRLSNVTQIASAHLKQAG